MTTSADAVQMRTFLELNDGVGCVLHIYYTLYVCGLDVYVVGVCIYAMMVVDVAAYNNIIHMMNVG